MSSLFDSLSEELFQVLKGSGKTLTLFDEAGNRTYEPKGARRFFATPDNMMVSVIESGSDSEVKLYLSQSTDIKDISRLINTLRQITTRYNVLFNVRKYGKELEPRDFAFQAGVMESSMWGTTRTSYQKFGSAKLIVRHCQPVREGVIGSRGRNILGMFVENDQGERFKFPENHLSGGRAFAQHVAQGGRPHDETSISLGQMARESLDLSRVSRYIRFSKGLLGEEATALRLPIATRLVELRRALVSMSRPRGYHKTLGNLPLATADLQEAQNSRYEELLGILKIDHNHALAESLMPVALLATGDIMTKINEMFHGVISLEEADASALVGALLDEYGHESDQWTRMGGSMAFNESAVYEDAMDYLGLTETAYQINEGDAILDYATNWSKHRFAQSEAGGFDDPKDRKKFDDGIAQLDAGLRAILGDQVEMPEYPWGSEPRFSDENAKIRFFLDLFVAQHKLGNDATSNYVSSIIDKMAQSQKLDGAEKTVAHKLYTALVKDIDLDEAVVDESRWTDDPYYDDSKHEAAIESTLQSFEAEFNPESFLATQGYEDFLDDTMHPDDKASPTSAKYFTDGIVHMINLDLEAQNITGMENAHSVQMTAADLFKTKVLPLLQNKGWNITETLGEFAQTEDQPGHHGFSAGEHVGTDRGPAEIVSVEGDIAHVSFLHGGTAEIHVDDMDKLPDLAKFGEERELDEWFNGFLPENVLNELAQGSPYSQGKIAKAAGHKANTCPHNPDGQEGQAWLRGFHGMSEPFVNDIDEDRVDELSSRKVGDYFNKAASARGKAEKAGDDAKMSRRERGLKMAFDKMRESDEDMYQGATHIQAHANDLDGFLKQVSQRGGWAVEEQARNITYGDEGLEEQNPAALKIIRDVARSCGEDELFKELDTYLNMHLGESEEEVIGGDKGEDLINDVQKVDEGDLAFQAELEKVLKNARFRM